MCDVSLPTQLWVEAWLEGEGVSRARRIVGEAVGLRRKALQTRGGMCLQKSRLHAGVVEAAQGSRGG